MSALGYCTNIPSPLCSCVSAENAANAAPVGLEESVETIKADEATSALGLPLPALTASRAADASNPDNHTAPKIHRLDFLVRQSTATLSLPNFDLASVANLPLSRALQHASRPASVSREVAPCASALDHPRRCAPQPVEYDRKSCPVNNDSALPTLRSFETMKMEMGLLEAKMGCRSSLQAQKVEAPKHHQAENFSAYNAGVCSHQCFSTASSCLRCRVRLDARSRIHGQSRCPPCASKRSASVSKNVSATCLTSCATVPGMKAAQTEPLSSEALSVRNKFGQAPPPPLPGMPAVRSSSASPRSFDISTTRQPSGGEDGSMPRRLSCQSMPTSAVTWSLRDPMLTQTSPSPPSFACAIQRLQAPALDRCQPQQGHSL